MDQLMQQHYTLPVETVDDLSRPTDDLAPLARATAPLTGEETDDFLQDMDVPTLSGSTSTAITRLRKRRSTTGGKVALKKQKGSKWCVCICCCCR